MLLLLVLSIPAAAAEAPSPGDDPLARHLFPPERVMGHAQEIGLDDTQRTAIRKEVQKAQSKFLDLQFDIQTEMETMVRLVKENSVDEPKVLAQLDRVLSLEKEIKKTQISLLVRIKNILTPAQQAKLVEMPREPGK
jgi:Spy/CpxP family protein refolding chaperone